MTKQRRMFDRAAEHAWSVGSSMPGSNGNSYFGGLVNVCAQFFIAALAIYLAVELIRAVWFTLLLILLGLAFLIGIVVLVRWCWCGW